MKTPSDTGNIDQLFFILKFMENLEKLVSKALLIKSFLVKNS